MGPPNGASTLVSFFIDGTDVLDHNIATTNGVNVIEINAGFGTTSANFDDFRLTTPTPGDFNNDGKVDAADYVAWRTGGSPNPNSPDDYNTWRDHFGEGAASSSFGTAAGVPEPASALLLLMAVLALCSRRHPAMP